MKKKFDFLRIPYERIVSAVPGRHPIERALWIAIHVVALVAFAFMIFDTAENYKSTRTATHMATDMFSVNDIDFPAIGVCNINLISRRKAKNFVKELLQTESIRAMNISASRLLELARYIGHLYTFSIDEDRPGDIDLLHRVLSAFYDAKPNGPLLLAQSVGVECKKYVVRCQWAGVVRTCSDILEPRFTSDGQCCTFNYARWTDHFASIQDDYFAAPVLRSKVAGSNFGLWLMLDADADDYFYQLLPIIGFKVLIYTPTDYPDPPSGSTREVLVTIGTETFLNIGASIFDTEEDVKLVDAANRKCLFKSEMEHRFGGRYSMSDCIMECRVRDIVKKCSCIPFFYPRSSSLGNMTQCDHSHLQCLNYYQARWWGMSPNFDKDQAFLPGVFSEIPVGHLDCDCKPSCENVDYTVSRGFGALVDNVIIWETKENAFKRTSNHVALNVYFGHPTAMKLQHGVQYYWYELMSNFGALCSAFLGLSLMSGVEIIYKLFQTLLGKCGKLRVSTKVKPTSEVSQKQPQVYWQEIIPRLISPREPAPLVPA